jgi:ABC-type sugar transport system ATPase subunit
MLTPSSNTVLEPMTQRMLQDPSILVTHDQEEAMSMADHIIVMNKAKNCSTR